MRDRLRSRITSSQALSDRLRQPALALVESLPGGDRLLHGDLHPSNVFVGTGDEVVIDWGNTTSGAPAADIARTLHLVSAEAIPPDFPDRDAIVELVEGFRHTYLETVTGLTGVDEREIDRWMLPVIVARLDEGIEWEREPLMRRIESLLG